MSQYQIILFIFVSIIITFTSAKSESLSSNRPYLLQNLLTANKTDHNRCSEKEQLMYTFIGIGGFICGFLIMYVIKFIIIKGIKYIKGRNTDNSSDNRSYITI